MKLIGSKMTKMIPAKSEGRDGEQSGRRTCDNEPAERHGRDDHNEQTLDVVGEVGARKLYTDGKETRRQYHTH